MSLTVVTPFISKCAYMFCAAIAPNVAKSMFSPVEKRPSAPQHEMLVHVDEAGRDPATRAVDDDSVFPGDEIFANFLDQVTLDKNVLITGQTGTGAIEDIHVREQHLLARCLLPRGSADS